MRNFVLLAGCAALSWWPEIAAAQDKPNPRGETSSEASSEIVVTAQKREERLLDVPAAVSAIGGDQLQDLGVRGAAELAALVPSLQVQGGGPGASTLAIRGINAGREPSPLVGVVIDGVPYGSSNSFAFGGLLSLDSAMWDTQRVEVLRGPQGTLYGASAMGGLVNYIYNDPSLTDYEGAGEAEISSIRGSSDASYTLRAALSAPIVTDVVGLRLAGSRQHGAGFLDNPLLGRRDVNSYDVDNLHGTLLVRPNNRLDIRLSGFNQKLDRDADDAVIYNRTSRQPVTGSLDQGRARLEPNRLDFSLGSAQIDYDFGPVALSSITGYQRIDLDSDADYTGNVLGIFLANPALLGAAGVPPAATANVVLDVTTEKFTQEVRISSGDNQALTWLVGGFYTDEDSTNRQLVNGFLSNGAPQPVFSPGLDASLPSEYKEYALFGQASVDLTARLQLTGGARWSQNEQTYQQTLNGPLGGGLAFPATQAKEEQTTWLGALRYQPTPTQTVYARVAKGYRPGGPNVTLPGAALARTFASDTVTNYELGYKAQLVEGRVEFSLTGFYIDWSDIQVVVVAGGLSGRGNGGAASSQGVEVTATVRPTDGLTVGLSSSLIDAQLDEAIPQLSARAGERLPNTPRFSGSVYGEWRTPLSANLNFVMGGVVRFAGDRTTSYDANAGTPQYVLDGYVLADLRAGVETDRVSITAFVRNVGDERAQLAGSTTNLVRFGQAAVTIAQPRTIGIRTAARF